MDATSTSSAIAKPAPVFPPWDDYEIMDILRHGIAEKTWRWQDRRNMRLVCSRWREAVLLPQLFVDGIEDPNEIDSAVSRTSYLRIERNTAEEVRIRLGPALVHNRTIVKLRVAYIEWTDQSIEALAAGIASNRTLRQLEISIGYAQRQITTVVGSLLSNKYITKLNFNHCSWSREALQMLTKVLTENPTPRSVSLANPFHEDSYVIELVKAPSLIALSLKNWRFAFDGTETELGAFDAVATAICESTTLKKLNISQISRGMLQIASMEKILRRSKSIECLNLDRNGSHWDDTMRNVTFFRSFVDAIGCNRRITTLKMRYDGLGAPFISTLSAMLQSHENTNLKRLYLSANFLEDSGAVVVANLLKSNPSIEFLTVSKNGISPDVWAEVLLPLVYSKRLRIEQA